MRLLFTSTPGSGHLHPLLPLALAARDAGHDVRLAISPAACAGMRLRGFSVYRAGLDFTDPLVRDVERAAQHDPGAAVRDLFADVLARHMIPDLEAIVSSWRPDVVVSEVAEYASWVVAERHDIPRVMVGFGMYWGFDVLEAMSAGPALRELRRRAGLDPSRVTETLSAQPCLLFAPPGYQMPGMTLPATVHVFRPVVFDQSGDEGLPAWIDELGARPIVHATLGTAYNDSVGVLETILNALRGEEIDLVVTVGRDRDPATLGPLPANAHVERYIPQSLLLPHCDAVLSHGRYSTVMATLCEGLPMVLTPMGADQPFHAERCHDLGTAIVVHPSEIAHHRIREAVRTILTEPRHRDCARSVRDGMAQQPGIDRAVTLLERIGS